MSASETSFYVIGGTLRPDALSYVERPADRELFERLIQGEFCYVLTSRQMGKSSLMARTARRLRERAIRAVTLDLTAVGQNLTPEQWHDGLVVNLGHQLKLEDELDEFWLNSTRLSPVHRFFSAIREVVMKRLPEPLVVFVDEIDIVRSLPFSTDEFFAAIRECFNRRGDEPSLSPVTFCLLGMATPSDLIRNALTTPFNIGHRIELTDFTLEEAAPLARGFRVEPELAEELLERMLYWTHGHPYLTQRLCRATAEANAGEQISKLRILNRRGIDRLCEDFFLSNRARERDDNLLFVREWLLRGEANLAGRLSLYDRIRNHETVPDDEANPCVTALGLSGITRVENGCLRVRNRIYERVFDHDWVMANMPVLRASGATAIAVLPFVEASGDPQNEYWTDGLTEELINALGRIKGLSVASRTSSFQFKGKQENLSEIAAKLKIEVVLVGMVERFGDRVRISVELVNLTDGYRLWSETFTYRARDLTEIQHEIGAAIVNRLRFGQLESMDIYRGNPPTENLEAYNLYLKGRYVWNKRQEEPLKRSVILFEEAVRVDPGFALAYAGLADAYNLLGTYSYLVPKEAYPKAKTAGLRALEIDDSLAQPHATLGCTSAINDWDWVGAEAEFKRAIELNPSYATARQWYAINCLTPLGRHDEAISELRKAQAVDPLSLGVQASLALAFYYSRRFDEAIRQSRLTLEMEEDFGLTHLFLAWSHLQQSEYESAIAACKRACEIGKNDPVALAALGQAYALAGHKTDAKRLLDKLLALAQTRYVPASEVAILWLSLGQTETALQWLHRALDEKTLRLIYLKVEPRFDELRSEPGFLEILRTVGLHIDG